MVGVAQLKIKLHINMAVVEEQLKKLSMWVIIQFWQFLLSIKFRLSENIKEKRLGMDFLKYASMGGWAPKLKLGHGLYTKGN